MAKVQRHKLYTEATLGEFVKLSITPVLYLVRTEMKVRISFVISYRQSWHLYVDTDDERLSKPLYRLHIFLYEVFSFVYVLVFSKLCGFSSYYIRLRLLLLSFDANVWKLLLGDECRPVLFT